MLLHISKLADVPTEKEEAQLAAMSKKQLRYLSRKCCSLCEHPLDEKGCGSVYEACDESIRLLRRTKCLTEYKPREQRGEVA